MVNKSDEKIIGLEGFRVEDSDEVVAG